MPSVPVNLTAAGPTTLVSAPGAGKSIYITGLCLTADGTTLVTLENGDGADVTYIHCVAGGGAVWHNKDSTLTAGVNKSLALLKSEGAVRVSGHVNYEVY